MSRELEVTGRGRGPARPGTTLAEFAEAMPYLLISMLERRYLGDLQLSRWALEAPPDDGARPLLREILALPRPGPGEDPGQAMPSILSASHTLGQAVTTAVFGDGIRHRFFLGGRRVPQGAIGSTEDFLAGQASVLRAHLPGLELGPVARLDGRGLTDLAGFLADAPALAAVTGIPSRRGAAAAVYQNLDRLTDAAAGHRYAVLIVAEPLDPAELDAAVDTCRRLKSEVHALVRQTVTQARAEGTTESTTTRDENGHSESRLPDVLSGFGMFCSVAGLLVPGLHALAPMASPAMLAGNLARARGFSQPDTVTTGTTETLSRSGTAELLNANAEACEALLETHIRRLEAARSDGWWRTAVYVAAETDGAIAAITAALRAICSGTATALDPMRAIRIAPWAMRPALTRGQTLALRPTAQPVGHPLGEAFDALATCMTTDELSVLMSLPRREVAGLRMRDVGEFALAVPPAEPRSVIIGRLTDPHGRDLDDVRLSADELNRHVLITGMTGYGKTTTAKNLLVRAHAVPGHRAREGGVPAAAVGPGAGGALRVYSVTGRGPALPLRLNPFVPVDGAPLGRHIDPLKSVFNAAFPMFAGMAMLDVYTERGWNLRTGRNDALGERPTPSDTSALSPTMRDLHDQIEVVLARKADGTTWILAGSTVISCYPSADAGMRNVAVAVARQLGFPGKVVGAVMGLTENYVATLHRRGLREGTAGLVRGGRAGRRRAARAGPAAL